jgi:hypothetical protein
VYEKFKKMPANQEKHLLQIIKGAKKKSQGIFGLIFFFIPSSGS